MHATSSRTTSGKSSGSRGRTGFRSIVTPAVLLRLALGWGSFLLLLLAQPLLAGGVEAASGAEGRAGSAGIPTPLLFAVLGGIVVVIVVCAFGVVIEAEHLARRLGDPYGTLILTLSIVLIEVILISAVMLGPGEHATIARDSVMAVSMIILNLVVGVALLVGGLRHGGLRHNRTGVSTYLALLIVLSTLAFALPGLIGESGAYPAGQAIPIAAMTVLLYAFFLFRQMGAQRGDFQEVSIPPTAASGIGAAPDPVVTAATAAATAAGVSAAPAADSAALLHADADERKTADGEPEGSLAPRAHPAVAEVLRRHRAEIAARVLVLVATVVPVVLLSHDMAALLDDGLGRLGAPVALSGILIAMIVFLPETITTIRAAHAGEMQRVSNLCHGALVSTVGLTIPAVLAIGLLTGQRVVLAEDPTNLVLLGATLLLSVATFSGGRVTALHGAAHLMVFLVFALTVFA